MNIAECFLVGVIKLAMRDPWEPRQRLEHSYFQSLQEIINYLWESIKNTKEPYDIIRLLNHAFNAPEINRYAEQAAQSMVTHVWADGARSWREAARIGGKGNIILAALKNELHGPLGSLLNSQIQRNAQIIKTLPLDIADHVTDYIGREAMKGRRATDIAEDIQKMFPQNSRAKAQLIARTEVSKTSTALTQGRAEMMGLEYYEWRTSEDSRVRESHRKMDHVLIRWSDPPSPEELDHIKSTLGHYHAGNAPNCRCYPAPVLNFDRLTWPHKIYMNGQIQMMTLSKIKAIGRITAA
jgi:SPP1 gp7 family putative phage head morphogenesis protein